MALKIDIAAATVTNQNLTEPGIPEFLL